MLTLRPEDHHRIESIIHYANRLPIDQLVTGTSGNISCLLSSRTHLAITPTGVEYGELTEDKISIVSLDGHHDGGFLPSSETPMHLEIFRNRPEVQAVVHTHSMYATTFSVRGVSIPALHYMIAALGGNQIPITSHYEPFGTKELARTVVNALDEKYKGVIMRNHGALTVGSTVAEAYKNAVILEEMAELYYRTLTIGEPTLLSTEQMEHVLHEFQTYGKQK